MELQKYQDCFMKIFGVEADALNADFNFGTGKWNSFAHMELMIELEDSFDIMLESDDIMRFGGYENGKNILSKYGVAF